MEYTVGGKKLVWNFTQADGGNAAKLQENNLYIEGFWNMKDTVGRNETCVMLNILSEDTFYFVIFAGLGYTMQVKANEVICLGKQITK